MDTSQLFQCLKKSALKISIHDLIKAKTYIEFDTRHLPEKYQKEYSQKLFKYIFDTLVEIKNKTSVDEVEHVDKNEYQALIDRINCLNGNSKSGNDVFNRLMKIILAYLIFIAKKPVHPVGLIFPGSFSIIEKKYVYYCPVKNKQSGIKFSLCDFCVCRDSEELKSC